MPRVAITEPGLVARQAMADEDFTEHFYELAANFAPRDFTQEQFERGLRYPWSRPEHSYLLRAGEPVALDDVDRRVGERLPLLAFGSNAAPRNLAIKLAHHPEGEEQEVPVLVGEVHDLDVVATAAVTVYGAMPATIAASPGTRTRAALLLVTPMQLTTLTWGEMPYRLGALRDAPFVAEDGRSIPSPLAFVCRWGTFLPDGEPAALAAIGAERRRFRAWAQRELLDRAAEIVLGPGHDAEPLMRWVCELGGAAARRSLPLLREHSRPFDHPGWTPLAPDGTLSSSG